MTGRSRFNNVLVVTPEGCADYIHTRALRRFSNNILELNFIETSKRFGIVETRKLISLIVARENIEVLFLTVYADSYLLPLEFLRDLRKTVKIVLVTYDDENAFETHSKYYAQVVDAVVTTDFFSINAYRGKGVPAILCLNSVSKTMFPLIDTPKDIDVSFVGNCLKADRKEYLDFLTTNGINVQSFGFGSSSGFLPISEVAKVFCRTKINLSFSKLENQTVTRTTGHKGRIIEAALTGSFCLSEFYPALPHVFDIGKEIDCFTDRESLLAKVRFYLSHELERKHIASLAHARALRDYEEGPSFGRVMDELAVIFSRPAGPAQSPALLNKSSEFMTNQISDLFVHGLSMVLRGRLAAFVAVGPELLQYGPRTFISGVAGGMARVAFILRQKFR